MAALAAAAGPSRAEPVEGAARPLAGPSAAASPPPTGAQIRVAVRVRPVSELEERDSIIEVAGLSAISVRKEAGTGGNEFLRSQRGRTEERFFDRVFGPGASQSDVFEWSCRPQVAAAVREGRSATVFAYGATGAGKTHTMFGEREEEAQGLLPRALREVFLCLTELQASTPATFEAKVSFLDIYNETVRDLLQDGNAMCKVLEDARENRVKITNLREVVVDSAEEALRHLRLGLQARKVEATAANARSSRSHAVFSVTVERVEAGRAGPGHEVFGRRDPEQRWLHSRICLIDLAGSERAKETLNTGSALKDGAKINQSLLALANCIDALVSGHCGTSGVGAAPSAAKGRDTTPRRKAPFRDSKLTLLLKGSLTSDCLVSMIANVHPGKQHFEDSNNTLEYAKRASAIKAPIVVRRAARALSLPSLPVVASPLASPRSGPHHLAHPAAAGSRSPVLGPAPAPFAPPRKGAEKARPKCHLKVAPMRLQRVACITSRASVDTAVGPRLVRRQSFDEEDDEEEDVEGELELAEDADEVAVEVMVAEYFEAVGTSAAPGPPSRRLSRCSETLESCSGSSTYDTAAGTESESIPGWPAWAVHGAESESPGVNLHLEAASSGSCGSRGRSSDMGVAERGPQLFTPRRTPSRTPSPLELSATGPAAAAGANAVELPLRGGRDGAGCRRRPGTSLSPSPTARAPAPVPPSATQPFGDDGKDQGAAKVGFFLDDGWGGACGSVAGTRSVCCTEGPRLDHSAQHEELLLRLIESLQSEKAGLNSKLDFLREDRDRLEEDNAQLRAANLEKDRQLAALLGTLPRPRCPAPAVARGAPGGFQAAPVAG